MFDNFSRVEMFEALEKRNPKFDAVASSFTSIRKFGIKDIEGVFTYCGGFQAFVPVWNNLFGNHIHPASFQSGKRFYIQWVEGSEEVTPTKPEVTPEPTASASLISLDVEVPVVVEEGEEMTDKKEVDWDWVGTLSNNKFGKIKLDEYAAGFDCNLNRRNTIDNMIEDFKTQLSNK